MTIRSTALLFVLLAACNHEVTAMPPDAAGDASSMDGGTTMPDATTHDASMPADTGTTPPDASTPADAATDAPDAAAPADVAACEAAVDDVRAACVAEDPTNPSPRICSYDALRPLCTQGRTAVVRAIFDCLRTDACQSPSDPSGAEACIRDVVHTMATAADHAAGHAICACGSEPGCTDDEPLSLANLMMAPVSEVSDTVACLGAHTCAEASMCAPTLPSLAAFFECAAMGA